MSFKTHEEFFERVGEDWLHPKHYGECIWPVTVEEMYQHFKARLLTEIAVESPELLNRAEVIDVAPNARHNRPSEAQGPS